jgi:hypothetical protein
MSYLNRGVKIEARVDDEAPRRAVESLSELSRALDDEAVERAQRGPTQIGTRVKRLKRSGVDRSVA